MRRAVGITVVELLVALAIGGAILTAAYGAASVAGRLASAIDERGTVGQRATSVPYLLAGALAHAGRGLDGCGLHVADAGRRVRAEGVRLGEHDPRLIEVFAGADGGGRPALYWRSPPAVRQPWLEEVTRLVVTGGRDDRGAWRAVDHDVATRWTALRIALTWSDGDEWSYEVRLPHAPCAEVWP